AYPGATLDVQSTIRATYFVMSGQTPSSGLVLTATDTAGDATWSSTGAVSGWTITNTTDAYKSSNGNVGIGTTFTNGGAALTVMNGNVGIGTWGPSSILNARGGESVLRLDSSHAGAWTTSD